jgi:hypothetical protein
VDIHVSAYCLRIKVVTPGVGGGNIGSKHKLIVKRNKDWTADLPGNAITERQLHCKDHYKALVAGWWLHNPDFTWYMGMDPRPKTRAYRFLNSHGASEDVDLAALCFNYRTT